MQYSLVITKSGFRKKTIEKDVNAADFKKASQVTKETNSNFVTYVAQLKDLTQEIKLEKSDYVLNVKVFCQDNLVSETEQYLKI